MRHTPMGDVRLQRRTFMVAIVSASAAIAGAVLDGVDSKV
jgi:hypothetical protein